MFLTVNLERKETFMQVTNKKQEKNPLSHDNPYKVIQRDYYSSNEHIFSIHLKDHFFTSTEHTHRHTILVETKLKMNKGKHFGPLYRQT